ncbi:hypothetical protein [Georgenia faecalis]|uniref:hypothetical protein n=1 Tax=Georgenia faecalis TaxID=2483799 RepID=UPI000FD8A28D|nr:hypothetical protein [Georgenia faecalis]
MPSRRPTAPRQDRRPDAPHPGGAHPDGARRGRPQPTPEQARAATRPVMWFSLVLLTAVVVPMMGVRWPLPLVSGALALAALVVGVYALVRVWRAGVRGAIVPTLAISLVLAAYLLVSAVVQAAMWPAYAAYADCTDRALTVQAERACRAELEDAVTDRILGQEAPAADRS